MVGDIILIRNGNIPEANVWNEPDNLQGFINSTNIMCLNYRVEVMSFVSVFCSLSLFFSPLFIICFSHIVFKCCII